MEYAGLVDITAINQPKNGLLFKHWDKHWWHAISFFSFTRWRFEFWLKIEAGFGHSDTASMDLLWLPIWACIHYKILMLVHRAVNRMGPVCLQSLVAPYTPGQSLCSSCSLLLARPRARTKAGDAAFPSAVAVLWNLPLVLRQIQDERGFRTALKTYLFRHAHS